MEQVKCPDCGEVYSEDIQSCPNCGCPNDNWKSKPNQQGLTERATISVGWKKYQVVFIIVCMLIVGICSFFIGTSLKSNPKQAVMSVDTTLIKKAIKDSLEKNHRAVLQKQIEEANMEREREKQARQEEERKRMGTDIDITLNAYFDRRHFHNIGSNFGVYKSLDYYYLESQRITIPKGKVWVFKGCDIDGHVTEAIVGKDTGGGYISGTDRYDLRNHEAFTIMGGTSIRILFVVYSEPQQINTVCHFKEKDMEDL